MNKIKTIINIYKSAFLILVLLQSPCHANKAKDNKYIDFALKSFFNLRGSATDNQIYSPLGVNSCVSAFNLTLEDQEKTELDAEIKSSGISNQELFNSDNNADNLQFFTTMLTRYASPQAEKDRVKQANIILGEYLLNADSNQQEEARRNEFKQKIEDVLQQKFKGQQSLDYKDFWSSEPRPKVYLKILSALRFEAKWQDRKFKKIGKRKFTTFDNQEIEVDSMKNKIKGLIKSDDASQWQSVRIFYENNYVLDIIVPQTDQTYSNADKIKIIAELIAKSNSQVCKDSIKLQMPLFTFKKESALTSMLKEMFPSFQNKNIELKQECIIKVDEEGTIAEAVTNMAVSICKRIYKEFVIDKGFYYMISKVEETKGYIYSDYEIKDIIMMGAIDNPLLEK